MIPFARFCKTSRGIAGLAAAVALLFATSAPAWAGGATVCVNCATAYTQLSQYVHQIQSALEEAQTVRNTMQSSMYLQQSLKQLDPSTLSQLSGGPLSNVQSMASEYGTLGNLTGSYNTLLSQASAFQTGAEQNNMTPDQYLQFQVDQAKAGNAQYSQQVKMEQSSITDANQQLAQLNAESSNASGVTSQVQGMQQLLADNVKTQELLVTMNKNIEVANLNAAQEMQANKANNAATLVDQQNANALSKQLATNVKYTLPSNSQLLGTAPAQPATYNPLPSGNGG